MSLVAPVDVLTALKTFQAEIAYVNSNNRQTDERHDELLAVLLRAMRKDIHPKALAGDQTFPFRLLGIPPDANPRGRIHR
jgi:hypothetical protein